MVLELLWTEKSHLSARDIFLSSSTGQGRNIGHTSVIQNLEALQSAGVIECLRQSQWPALTRYRQRSHSQSHCLESGAIHDLLRRAPNELVQPDRSAHGFEIESRNTTPCQLSGAAGLDTPSAAPLPWRGAGETAQAAFTLTALACPGA